MTSILARYLSLMLLSRYALFAFAIIALAALMEFLANGDDIMQDTGGSWLEIFKYTLLTLPDVFSRLASFAALLASLITLIGLTRHTELTAMVAAGMSQWGLMLTIMPAAILIAGFQFWMDNSVLPQTSSALRDWGVGDYARTAQGNAAMIWAREDRRILRIGAVNVREETLSDITIFRRDERGLLVERMQAPSATFEEGYIILEGVTRTFPDQARPILEENVVVELSVDIRTLAALSGSPREKSWLDTRSLVIHPSFGNQPNFLYELWLHKKIAGPIGTIIIIMLVVPLVQRFERLSNQFLTFLIGLSVGFLYVAFDAMLVALGEAGLLPPILAAWTSTLVLLSTVGSILFERELMRAPATLDENRLTE
jgi:lipopolysaccharide export system permease protein